MKRLLLALSIIILISACTSPSGAEPLGSGDERWAYIMGPNGEHCLVFREGWTTTQMIAMDCDTVNWESESAETGRR